MFRNYFANPVYSGRLTEKVMEQFKELVLKATNQYISGLPYVNLPIQS